MTNQEIIEAIESMTLLQVKELVDELKEKFGVTGAIAVAGAAQPGDNAGGDPGGIELVGTAKAVLRNDHKQGGAQGHQYVGPDAGAFGADFAFVTYGRAKQCGSQNPYYKLKCK